MGSSVLVVQAVRIRLMTTRIATAAMVRMGTTGSLGAIARGTQQILELRIGD
jgi:hypothetical protein